MHKNELLLLAKKRKRGRGIMNRFLALVLIASLSMASDVLAGSQAVALEALVKEGKAHYENADGLTNFVVAVECFRKAAEQNHAEAQFLLGWCYRHGEGVSTNRVEAIKWWRKSAEQGFAEAQLALGDYYAIAKSVPKYCVEAVKWYRLAAEQGNAKAQYNLGICYREGIGVLKDSVEAEKWFRLAAEQGLEEPPRKSDADSIWWKWCLILGTFPLIWWIFKESGQDGKLVFLSLIRLRLRYCVSVLLKYSGMFICAVGGFFICVPFFSHDFSLAWGAFGVMPVCVGLGLWIWRTKKNMIALLAFWGAMIASIGSMTKLCELLQEFVYAFFFLFFLPGFLVLTHGHSLFGRKAPTHEQLKIACKNKIIKQDVDASVEGVAKKEGNVLSIFIYLGAIVLLCMCFFPNSANKVAGQLDAIDVAVVEKFSCVEGVVHSNENVTGNSPEISYTDYTEDASEKAKEWYEDHRPWIRAAPQAVRAAREIKHSRWWKKKSFWWWGRKILRRGR